MKVDPSFCWADQQHRDTKWIDYKYILPRKELYSVLDATDSCLVFAILYKSYITLYIDYDGMRCGPDLFHIPIPDPYLFETLFQISPLTKVLANKYINYEANTLDEYKICFMARILGKHA